MSRNIIRIVLSAFVIFVSSAATSATVEQLFEQPVYKQVKISPAGEYLGIRVFKEGTHSLVFVKRATLDVVGGLKFRGSDEVGDFYWANDDRVVAQVFGVGNGLEAPRNYGELYAVNADGTRAVPIFGFRSGEAQVGSIIKKRSREFAWGELIDPFPADDKEILIASSDMSDSHDRRSLALMLDIYTGMEGARVRASNYGEAEFITDKEGTIRLVMGVDSNGQTHVEGLPAGAAEWVEFSESDFGSYFTPVAISDDRGSVYVLDNINSDKVGLYQLSLDGKQYKQVYANDEVDITDVNMSSDGRSVYALRLDKGFPSYVIIAGDHEEAKIFKNILLTFPGQTVDITSRSNDGQYWIIHTSSDVDAGSFYIYDREANALKLLFRSLPNVDPVELSKVEPIEFKSFDDRRITGYFTPAKARGDSVAPMVVLVHGGPRSRDYWQFDPEVQALATHGFSVLQVNYRGSSGFGDEFESAGDRHWGDDVQKDIIAGTRWAIDNGKAEKGRICIMGASFGAYSAVQSAILEPDLYACVAANAGIYDLALLYEEGDVEQRYWGEAYLDDVIGRDEEQLKQFSPVYNAAVLNVPVFLAHGKKDTRAPYEHAKRLRAALKKNDKQYEWFVKSDEAHGFYDTENQVEYFTAVLQFLDENLPH